MNKTQNNENSVFAEGLKHFLDRCDLNEKTIAKQCDISLPLVYNWLKGKNIPTYKSLQKLHELGMNVTEMFVCPNIGDDKYYKFKENYNQYTLEELKQDLLLSHRRFLIAMLKSGLQNAFNRLSQKEKIIFLSKSIDERLAELDELNKIIKDVSENSSSTPV